jgi:hypothetical protein
MPNEPEHRDILTAIRAEMADDDDAYRQCIKFAYFYNDADAATKEVIDMTLIHICGWSFATLWEKAAPLTEP